MFPFEALHKLAQRVANPSDHLTLRGTVEVVDDKGTHVLGKNLVLGSYRRIIASMMAGVAPAATAPANLVIGQGTSLPVLPDTALAEPYLVSSGGARVQIPINGGPQFDPAEPEAKVVFEFLLDPALQVYDPTVPGETTEFTINEWGMETSSGELLTRKVKPYIKSSGTQALVRWTIFV